MEITNFPELKNRETFILRIWRSQGENPGWLGQLQHVRSGETVLIKEPEAVLRFIQTQLSSSVGESLTSHGIK